MYDGRSSAGGAADALTLACTPSTRGEMADAPLSADSHWPTMSTWDVIYGLLALGTYHQVSRWSDFVDIYSPLVY